MQAQVQKVTMLPRCDIFEHITRVLHLRRKYVFWGQVELFHWHLKLQDVQHTKKLRKTILSPTLFAS